MSEINDAIKAAAELPLYDAAYYLWIRKRELDRRQFPPAKPKPANLNDPDVFGRHVRNVLADLHRERATAHDGPTFDRLKQAHPEASDEDVKVAIKAAVKLDTDCVKYFSYSNEGYSSDLNRAMDLATKANPGFQQKTYDHAGFQLATAMR